MLTSNYHIYLGLQKNLLFFSINRHFIRSPHPHPSLFISEIIGLRPYFTTRRKCVLVLENTDKHVQIYLFLKCKEIHQFQTSICLHIHICLYIYKPFHNSIILVKFFWFLNILCTGICTTSLNTGDTTCRGQWIQRENTVYQRILDTGDTRY